MYMSYAKVAQQRRDDTAVYAEYEQKHAANAGCCSNEKIDKKLSIFAKCIYKYKNICYSTSVLTLSVLLRERMRHTKTKQHYCLNVSRILFEDAVFYFWR